MKKHLTREKIESQFLLITGILVVLIGGPAFYTLMREPVMIETAKITKKGSRVPASVEEVAAAPAVYENTQTQVNEKNAVVQFNCDEDSATEKPLQEVSGPSLRIAGVDCEKEKSFEVRNKTNGFTAEVIFTKGNQFTTDYIDLSIGQNDLEVVSTEKNGSKVSQTLKINRRAPASVSN